MDEVQLWKTWADGAGAEFERYRAMLSADELDRMGRMRAGMARDEFVVARGLLRMLLGGALHRDGRALTFNQGRYGKPGLAGVRFNVTHSKGLILIALCREAEVGVDVEWVDEAIEALDIARQSFSPEEYERIAGAEAGAARARVFYETWTHKEAVAKAHGAGLLLPLTSFTVPAGVAAGRAVEVPSGAGDATGEFEGGKFFLHSLNLDENFLGSLASNRAGLRLRRFAIPFAR